MEARPWADGKTIAYRFHPFEGKPIPLGTDRAAAIRKVAAMTGKADDIGTIGKLWEQYKETADWLGLTERTRADYAAVRTLDEAIDAAPSPLPALLEPAGAAPR